MPRLTGAQAIVATLHAHGVEVLFGIPGVHTLPLYDALHSSQRAAATPRHVLARHEQGAGFMATGYARISGRTGVVLAITGPGVTNVATPMADAYADSLPLLVIATSLPLAALGRSTGTLHELKDQLGVMTALAGWTRAVARVEEIPEALHDALRALGTGRPRGAYLQVPLDLLEVAAELAIPASSLPAPAPPPPAEIAAAARLLREAERPLIVAGAGVTAAGANDRLAALAELLGAPVLLGTKSRDVLPCDFPLAVATRGTVLPDELVALAARSDAALVVGSKLGAWRTGHGRLPLPAALAQIDLDPAEIGRHYPVAVRVAAHAGPALAALLDALGNPPPTGRSRAAEVAGVRAAIQAGVRRRYGAAVALLDAVRTALPRDSVVVADMTMLGYASAEYLPLYGPRTFIHASELCSIGCGLPLALGAKVAAPERAVVALCGDGGFLLNAAELATAVQERLGVIAIVFNDSAYTAVKNDQRRRFGGRFIATDLVAPDYVALARAFGAAGVRAPDPPALLDALVAAQRHAGPTLIEVPLPSS